MANFVHLHTHSDYSLLDGACSIGRLVEQARSFSMPACSITDHGNLFGAIEFYQVAREAAIKPIIGCEVYVAPGSRLTKKRVHGEEIAYHLTLLCKDRQGYENLLELVTRGFTEGFYYYPRVDHELLREYSRGLVALSGCMKGEIPHKLIHAGMGKAKKKARLLRDIYGDEFYLELQVNGVAEQEKINSGLVEISKDLSIPTVATNDVHYIRREDARAQEVLLCIQTGKTMDDPSRLRFSSEELYFRSEEEMERAFAQFPGAVARAGEIASGCNLDLSAGKVYLPVYQTPPDTQLSLGEYLCSLCHQGLEARYPKKTPKMLERLDYELEIIGKMGYDSYFLIVWDFIRYAKEQGILVGPGRGSVAGSLVAYLLGITEIDPLRYGLLFERFLNPERKSLPDIDIDIQDSQRQSLIEYVRNKYGANNVAQIITFGTMAARASIRDVGRVLGMPYASVDRIAKLIPASACLEEAVASSKELRGLIEDDEQVASLFEIAQRIEGLTRHASTHAAGLVIAPEKLTSFTPLFRTNKNEITTQYEMHSLESIGLLKMDFLGLKTLNVIGETLELVRRYENTDLSLDSLPLDDTRTYDMLSQGSTVGVFQLESRGMQDLLKRLKPSHFEDLIAVLALYRPGPLQSGMVDDYIRRKNGESAVTYLQPGLESILKPTYGVILYQEQVMQIANELAGFSLGEADILRRAMGKKNQALMAEQKEKFLQGATRGGMEGAIAEKIFALIAHFAGYGFNKSHSTGYALISYQTAYLKANYPLEFLAALLTAEKDNSDKLVFYMRECARRHIPILAPDINQSEVNFGVVKASTSRRSDQDPPPDSIRFGLAAIKNVGEGAIRSVIEERRENGPFESLSDLCRRVDLRLINKKVLESLIKCGALDALPGRRAQKLAVLDEVVERAARAHRDMLKGQLSLFSGEAESQISGEAELPAVEDVPRLTCLNWEKELLGVYLSGHPLDGYENRIRACSTHEVDGLGGLPAGQQVRLVGAINGVIPKKDRKGQPMAFVRLETRGGSVEVVIFARIFAAAQHCLEEGSIVLVWGKADVVSQPPKVIATNVIPFDSPEVSRSFHVSISPGVCSEETIKQLRQAAQAHQGKNTLYLHFTDGNGQDLVVRARSLHVDCSEQLITSTEETLGYSGCWIDAS